MNDRILNRQIGFDSNYKTWHINNNNMLIYMHSDGGSIVCSEKIYPIKEGVLCFIGAKKYHYTMPDDTSTYVRSKVFAPANEFQKMLSLFPQNEKFSQIFCEESFVYAEIKERDRPRIEMLLDEIAFYRDDKKYGDVVFTSCLLRLLIFLSQNMIDAASPSRGFMHKAIEYISSNICDGIGIDDICEHVHMSKYHFCRSFKKATGLTVMEYILKTRIVLSKNMLVKENFTISEISEHCGFSSISYFCRVFKEDCGLTPLQYRKKFK